MPSEDQATPVNHGREESGLGWLLQPTWEMDMFGEIAEATRMTPDVLSALEGALAASKQKSPMLASACAPLTKCGTFDGSGPEHPCPNLKECDKFTGTARTGTGKTGTGRTRRRAN